MGLPPGEVGSREVAEWAMDQAQYLSPTQAHVLLYLSLNAFVRPDNPEGRHVGDVLSGRVPISKIQHRTGYSERAVRDALRDLQDAGYIIAQHRPGNGRSTISVFWEEAYDEMRAEVRAGVRDLPKPFHRTKKQRPLEVVKEGKVLPFRSGT